MSETTTKPTGNVRWAQKPANTVTLVVGNMAATSLFAGLTLHQIGGKFGLSDEDIKVVYSTNPNNQQRIRQLAIRVEGTTYVIPFSRGFDFAKLSDGGYLLNCKFRGGFMSVKDDDGAPKTDENGKTVLDTTKPYLSFGKPEGIVIEEEATLFAPMTEEEIAAISAGNS